MITNYKFSCSFDLRCNAPLTVATFFTSFGVLPMRNFSSTDVVLGPGGHKVPGIPVKKKLKHASIVSPLDSKHVSTSPLLACPSTHPQFGIPLPHRPQMPRPARCCLWMLRVLSWLARGHFGPDLRIGLFCRHSSVHQVLSSHLPVLPIATDTNQ